MEEITKQDEVEIDLKEIMSLIAQRGMVIILVALCVGIFLYTNTKSKVSTVYTSTTKMYILSKNNLENTVNGDSQFVTSVLQDYKALVTSKEILEEVDRKLNLGRGYEALASQITLDIPADSRVAKISVTDTNPILAMKITNTVRDVMSQYLQYTMNIKLFDVIEEATIGAPQTQDKAKRNAVLGGFLSACLIIGIIVVRYLINDSIKTPEEIESKLGLCVLASIPLTEKKVSQKERKTSKHKKKNAVQNANPESEGVIL